MKYVHYRLKSLLVLLRFFLVCVIVSLVVACGLLPPKYSMARAGETNDIVVGSDGSVHLLFPLNTTTERGSGKSFMYYAKKEPGGEWQIEELYGGESAGVFYADELTLDPDGTLHAFFREARTVFHATKSGSSAWSVTTMADVDGPTGGAAFDSAGGMHVSQAWYRENTLFADNLRPSYTYCPAVGTLTTTSIPLPSSFADVNYGRHSDVVVDQSGKAHIIFGKEGSLVSWIAKVFYASAEPGGGPVSDSVSISDSGSGNVATSIAIDSAGTLHVVFEGYQDPDTRLRYIYSTDGGATWEPQEIIDNAEGAGRFATIEVDQNDGLHAGCGTNSDAPANPYALKYAYALSSAGPWTVETVGDVAHHGLSFTIDSSGTPFFAYSVYSGGSGPDYYAYTDMKVAYKDASGSWVYETVMVGAPPYSS